MQIVIILPLTMYYSYYGGKTLYESRLSSVFSRYLILDINKIVT